MPAVKFSDLSPELRKQLRGKLPRQQRFSAEQMRKWSIKVLAAIADLDQQQRRRVLEHAIKLNKV